MDNRYRGKGTGEPATCFTLSTPRVRGRMIAHVEWLIDSLETGRGAMSNDDKMYLSHRARQSLAQAEQASCPEAKRVQNELARLYAAALRPPLASTR